MNDLEGSHGQVNLYTLILPVSHPETIFIRYEFREKKLQKPALVSMNYLSLMIDLGGSYYMWTNTEV